MCPRGQDKTGRLTKPFPIRPAFAIESAVGWARLFVPTRTRQDWAFNQAIPNPTGLCNRVSGRVGTAVCAHADKTRLAFNQAIPNPTGLCNRVSGRVGTAVCAHADKTRLAFNQAIPNPTGLCNRVSGRVGTAVCAHADKTRLGV